MYVCIHTSSSSIHHSNMYSLSRSLFSSMLKILYYRDVREGGVERNMFLFYRERVNTLLETCKIVKSKILYVLSEGKGSYLKQTMIVSCKLEMKFFSRGHSKLTVYCWKLNDWQTKLAVSNQWSSWWDVGRS